VVCIAIVTGDSPGTVLPLGPRTTEAALRLRSDDDLMELSGAGVLAAFEELVRRHQRPVRAFCARMLGDGALAEDAAQDVFLEVWRVRGRYQGQGRLRSFLLTCARNRCLNAARQRRELVPLEEPPVPASADQLDALLAAERRQYLTSVMRRLPPKLHEALALRFAGGLEYDEIARVTGRGEETIRSRVFLGLKRLRALLGEGRRP